MNSTNLKTIYEISRAMSSARSQSEVLDCVASSAGRIRGCTSAAILVIDDSRSSLTPASGWQMDPDALAGLTAPISEVCFQTEVLRDSAVRVLDDADPATQRLGAKSLLGVPIGDNSETAGVLIVASSRGHWSETAIEQARVISSLAATALSFWMRLSDSQSRVIDLETANERLSLQAAQDGLTGLPNHRALHQRLTEQWHRVGRYGEVFTVAMIDVDHFKAYNDAYGHREGDFALQKIASIIQAQLRESDFAARYGGEEFAIILPHTAKPQARVALERIRRAVDTFTFPNGKLTISAGIAECPGDGVTSNEAVEKADRSLYHAKITGRNRICAWSSPADEVSNAVESGNGDARQVTVLIVENDSEARNIMEKTLVSAGYDIHRATSTEEASELLRRRTFDIMLSDALILGADGMLVLGLASEIHPTMAIVLTAAPSMAGAAREAMRHGITDLLVRPFDQHELPVVIERNLERKRIERQMLLERSTGILLQAIDALVAAIDAKDRMTAGHTSRVTHVSLAIADTLGLPSEERYTLELASRLHDIGKISLPDSALNKAGALSDEEWNSMMRHPAVGSQIVGAIGDLSYVATIVRHHHERLDGKGYPDGLQGDAIPFLARIIAVADAYEAMTSERSFRRKMTPEEAVAELSRCVDTHYSAGIVQALVDSLQAGTIEEDQSEAA